MKQHEGLDCLGYLSDVLFLPSNGVTPSHEDEFHSLNLNDEDSWKRRREEPLTSLAPFPAVQSTPE